MQRPFVCVFVCVYAYVRACVRARVRACVRAPLFFRHDRRAATKFGTHYVDWSGNDSSSPKLIWPTPEGSQGRF